MRVSKEAKAETHQRIVAVASRLFRERGVDEISVADIMAAAGLTHGGFYRHFSSKDDLAAAAIGEAIGVMVRKLKDDAARRGAEPAAAAYVDLYLSAEHVGALGKGCAIAALASEAAHESSPISEAMAQGAEQIISALTPAMTGDAVEARRKAIAAFATLLGSLLLARIAGSRLGTENVLAAGRKAAHSYMGGKER